MSRPTPDEYFGAIAQVVATRADCTRDQVGAVIVRDGRIVSTGYNGAPAGEPGCLTAGACPRGRLTKGECAPDSSYANCISIHAEANAILYADYDKLKGATIYVTRDPCHECARLVKAAGIRRVVVTPRLAHT